MQLPVSLRNGIHAQQAILTTFLDDLRPAAAQARALYSAINHNVGDVDPLRAEFARHALRQHAQARFRCCEMRETRFAAQASGSAREQKRAAAQRHKPSGCLASDQKATKAADAPEFLEH